MRVTMPGLALALLLSASSALAATPAKEVVDLQPPPPPTAGQVKDAAKAAEARENAASKSIEDMLRKAQSPFQTGQPLQPVSGGARSSGGGGRKAIYGDIIIHK